MRCIPPQLAALSAFILVLPFARAEETPAAQELREIRQAVQQQSRQIEQLAAQISRLTRILEGQKAGPDAPTFESVTDAPKAEPVPKAELVSASPKHTVAKGETLTSIARQYNIPLADLKNANKIDDERKLQIGQILTIPTAITPATPDKKENP